MPNFPDPYNRERILGQEFEMPAPLEAVRGIGSYTINHDDRNRSFTVQRFREGTKVPALIAQWLHYRTFTDSRILTQTADDTYRFGDPRATRRRFLSDQGGRRLYCAVDQETGELSGVVWMHALIGLGAGASVVQACVEYNSKTDDPDKQVHPTRMATLASRVYYEENRGKGIHTPLLLMALADYKQRWPNCEGVMIRVSKGDGRAMHAFQSERLAEQHGRFEPVVEIQGAVFMLNRGLITPGSGQAWSPRTQLT